MDKIGEVGMRMKENEIKATENELKGMENELKGAESEIGSEEKQAESKEGTSEKKPGRMSVQVFRANILPVATALFCTLAAVIIFFFLFYRLGSLRVYVADIVDSLTAVIIGLVIAYILNPLMKRFEKQIFRIMSRKKTITEKEKKVARGISIALSEIILVVIVVVLIMMLVPELINNIVVTVNQAVNHLQGLPDWLEGLLQSELPQNDYIDFEQILNDIISKLTAWMTGDLIGTINVASQHLMKSAIGIVNFILDFIIGIVVSMYVLAGKEHFTGIAKKALYALMKPEHANEVLEVIRKTDHIFGGFIVGKLVDSAIIGVLCYIGCLILRIPYALVVSVIVGVTNVIPFFGPFIGAIPSALLILMQDPLKGLIFIVFVVVLQQVDGNIIGPKILGESTGLNSFWIIFAILFAGGMFGVLGMIVGVPAFAVLYYLIKRMIDRKLRRKSMPTDSDKYIQLEKVEPETREIVYDKAD